MLNETNVSVKVLFEYGGHIAKLQKKAIDGEMSDQTRKHPDTL